MILVNWLSDLINGAIGPSIIQWVKDTAFFKFLTQKHSIYGWVISLVLLVLLGFFLFFFYSIYRNRSIWKGKNGYISHGLEWNLTPMFFQNYEEVLLRDIVNLQVYIIGPFCPICKVDVTDIIAGGTFICLNGHSLKNTEAYRIIDDLRKGVFAATSNIETFWNVIRSRVYTEAQGKARNGLL